MWCPDALTQKNALTSGVPSKVAIAEVRAGKSHFIVGNPRAVPERLPALVGALLD
jgi:hypothetical protein